MSFFCLRHCLYNLIEYGKYLDNGIVLSNKSCFCRILANGIMLHFSCGFWKTTSTYNNEREYVSDILSHSILLPFITLRGNAKVLDNKK